MKRGNADSPKGFLLDQFTQIDLRAWQKLADAEQRFHTELYYHLEAQRNLHEVEIREALLKYQTLKFDADNWFRIVDFVYSLECLSPAGSLHEGGRFNIGNDLDSTQYPSFPALYLASGLDTAFCEKFGAPISSAQGGFTGPDFALQKPGSFTAVNVRLSLRNVFDLSNKSNLRGFVKVISKFKMPTELVSLGKQIGRKPPWLLNSVATVAKGLVAEDWRLYPIQLGIPSNSQVFGRILKNAGFEGVIFPSTKGPESCLVVFVENLDGSDSFIEVTDDPPRESKPFRLDSDTWQELSEI